MILANRQEPIPQYNEDDIFGYNQDIPQYTEVDNIYTYNQDIPQPNTYIDENNIMRQEQETLQTYTPSFNDDTGIIKAVVNVPEPVISISEPTVNIPESIVISNEIDYNKWLIDHHTPEEIAGFNQYGITAEQIYKLDQINIPELVNTGILLNNQQQQDIQEQVFNETGETIQFNEPVNNEPVIYKEVEITPELSNIISENIINNGLLSEVANRINVEPIYQLNKTEEIQPIINEEKPENIFVPQFNEPENIITLSGNINTEDELRNAVQTGNIVDNENRETYIEPIIPIIENGIVIEPFVPFKNEIVEPIIEVKTNEVITEEKQQTTKKLSLFEKLINIIYDSLYK